jgi:cell wall assembly regulator SMI1
MVLLPTEADTIAGIEAEVGKRLPDNLRESVHRAAGTRAQVNAEYEAHAKRIIGKT